LVFEAIPTAQMGGFWIIGCVKKWSNSPKKIAKGLFLWYYFACQSIFEVNGSNQKTKRVRKGENDELLGLWNMATD